MDYVYLCRNGSNEELRYSIRSTVENLPEGNVWIIGGKPDWYTGNFVQIVQNQNKYDNVRKLLKFVCNSDKISDDFVLMNDDFFTMQKLDSVPTWNGGTLMDKIKLFNRVAPENLYVKMLVKVNNYLRNTRGVHAPIDYELHVPMVMNKKNLLQIIDQPYLWRSLYGNLFNVGGEKHMDVKIYDGGRLLDKKTILDLDDTIYMSTIDESFSQVKKLLEEKFPNPSPYERP